MTFPIQQVKPPVFEDFRGQSSVIRVADTPSSETDARRIWEGEGYELPKVGEEDSLYPEKNIRRKGSSTAGNGFYDVILTVNSTERRLVYYGPGEYVLPHSHNEKELFFITTGSTHVWLWNDFKNKWDYSLKQQDEMIEIDAGIPHCLIAGEGGLSMHVSRNDNTRSVDWQPDIVLPEPFSSALKALTK